MTRNIDVYDGHPNEAIDAFTKDPAGIGGAITDKEKDLIRRFMNWVTLPAIYQEGVERFDVSDPSTEDRVARSLESISDTLAKINANVANISCNTFGSGVR